MICGAAAKRPPRPDFDPSERRLSGKRAFLLPERRLPSGLRFRSVSCEPPQFSAIAAMPGRTFPSRNSNVAPPPVEMCEILSDSPVFFNAAMESPPPTMLVAPASVASATAFATASVPLANSSHSKTPIGPFQMIVFAPFSAST